MINELAKEITDIMKDAIPQKSIAESLLKMENPDKKLTTIGHIDEIDSEHKNEFFEEIFMDENGNIIDLRILKCNPTLNELEEMAEYWDELQIHFKKKVKPYFLIADDPS